MRPRGTAPALLLALTATLLWSGFALAKPSATITGEFGDSCRDFEARSSKDISHVEIHYADGRVVKDETVNSREFSIDGGAGDEIASAIVKSGTTTSDPFTCTTANSPPVAILEVKTPECATQTDGTVGCDGRMPRTTWTRSFVPALGFGLVRFFCQWPDDQSCVDHVMPCGQKDFYSLCEVTYTFRGTSSTDPDTNIEAWSIDFGDGTSTGLRDWATDPPTEISHTYLIHHCPTCSRQPATLTVTDSAGESDSDAQLVEHVYPE